jgi:OOP family OmpA-OmpF porin
MAEGALAQTTPAPAKPAPVEVIVPHGYVGLGAARTLFSVNDDAVKAPGATESTLNSGHNEWGYRFFAGYRFHRNVSIEAGLTDFGKFTTTREITQPVTGNLVGQTRVQGASLDLVGWLPFKNGFSFIGKIGGMYANTQTYYYTDGNYTLPPGSKNYVRNSEFVARYGLGLAYAVSERVTLRAEYEVSPKVGEEIEGDLKAGFVSVQVRF